MQRVGAANRYELCFWESKKLMMNFSWMDLDSWVWSNVESGRGNLWEHREGRGHPSGTFGADYERKRLLLPLASALILSAFSRRYTDFIGGFLVGILLIPVCLADFYGDKRPKHGIFVPFRWWCSFFTQMWHYVADCKFWSYVIIVTVTQ